MLENSTKPFLIILTDWFAPGYKAGGPVQSCVNVASFLQKDYQVVVVTTDRDLQEYQAYEGIITDSWTKWEEEVQVQYLSPERCTYANLRKIIYQVQPEYIYLNSMFSTVFSVYPLLMKWRGQINSHIVLAPRGMLRKSALQIKKRKKQLFLAGSKVVGLFRNITFHATNEEEAFCIQQEIGEYATIKVVPNLPKPLAPYTNVIQKQTGKLTCLWIARIHPIKNLLFLLQCLKSVNAQMELTLIGPVEDAKYWEQCQNVIKQLSKNITVSFIGELPPPQLAAFLEQCHLFILPTQGENFGHAIFEAFAAGRPVLISDQTPWRNLESQQVGWDLPLNKPELFIAALEQAAAMNQEEYNQWSHAAYQYAKNFIERSKLKEKYLELFS